MNRYAAFAHCGQRCISNAFGPICHANARGNAFQPKSPTKGHHHQLGLTTGPTTNPPHAVYHSLNARMARRTYNPRAAPNQPATPPAAPHHSHMRQPEVCEQTRELLPLPFAHQARKTHYRPGAVIPTSVSKPESTSASGAGCSAFRACSASRRRSCSKAESRTLTNWASSFSAASPRLAT